MTTEVFIPLSHDWKIERHYRPGLSHPTSIEKTCTSCKISGRKSFMEKIGPCPGVPHSADCIKRLGYMRMADGPNAYFECQCGKNKDHEKKPFWKVNLCRYCDREHGSTLGNLTQCLKAPDKKFHDFRWRRLKP
jgi:ribosomal protein S14